MDEQQREKEWRKACQRVKRTRAVIREREVPLGFHLGKELEDALRIIEARMPPNDLWLPKGVAFEDREAGCWQLKELHTDRIVEWNRKRKYARIAMGGRWVKFTLGDKACVNVLNKTTAKRMGVGFTNPNTAGRVRVTLISQGQRHVINLVVSEDMPNQIGYKTGKALGIIQGKTHKARKASVGTEGERPSITPVMDNVDGATIVMKDVEEVPSKVTC